MNYNFQVQIIICNRICRQIITDRGMTYYKYYVPNKPKIFMGDSESLE